MLKGRKYVVIGDLHGREVWKDIVKKESDADKIIFLGDYTVPRDLAWVYRRDPTDMCGFLYEVLDYKDKNPDKVVLLRGNHELDSLGYYWARCYPQDHPKVREYWQTDDVKNWYLKNTQWIYRIPDTKIVFSHAGCSTVFLKRAEKYLANNMGFYNPFEETDNRYLWLIDELNYIEPCAIFGFTDDNPFDTNGTSPCQPCTWIRPETLIDYAPNDIIQVVGHTPVKEHIFNCKDKYGQCNDLWCCDALGLKEPEYLVIENGEFKVCKI